MQIRATKTFCNYINKVAKQQGKSFRADLVMMNSVQRSMMTPMYSDWEYDEQDYDYNDGRYRTIRIMYPEDYYCEPRYLKTSDIVREFKRLNVETLEQLNNMIVDMFEI